MWQRQMCRRQEFPVPKWGLNQRKIYLIYSEMLSAWHCKLAFAFECLKGTSNQKCTLNLSPKLVFLVKQYHFFLQVCKLKTWAIPECSCYPYPIKQLNHLTIFKLLYLSPFLLLLLRSVLPVGPSHFPINISSVLTCLQSTLHYNQNGILKMQIRSTTFSTSTSHT